jgi:DNA polymerase alpha subunit A
LTANSLYGSLGSGFSRFSAKHLAAMITSQGRSILRDTVDSVEQQLNMDVVYGDTDSIMVATSESTPEAAQQIARQVQQVINGRYRLLELGIDGYFRRLLILGKKNYASLTMVKLDNGVWDQVIKPKGSSVIRKDVSELSLFTTM